MLTEKIFNTGTLTIHYAEGSPQGEPLDLLHGATARWRELMPLLGTAAQIPESIKALIVLDPPIFLREESIKSIPGYNYFLGVYLILTRQRTAQEVFSEFFQGIDDAGIHDWEEMFSQVDPEFVKTQLEDRYFDGLDTQSVLEKITCPTLFLYGEVDKGGVVREKDVEFFRAHIPNGTAIQIKAAGHLLHLDQPARALELITQ